MNLYDCKTLEKISEEDVKKHLETADTWQGQSEEWRMGACTSYYIKNNGNSFDIEVSTTEKTKISMSGLSCLEDVFISLDQLDSASRRIGRLMKVRN